MRERRVGKFEVYLRGGQTLTVKAVSIKLEWDANGVVTYYKFDWPKEVPTSFAMPPQSIIGVRRIK